MSKYIPVIGLEIHVELSTKSKMFCGCPADWFGKDPNVHTCPVCLGMPGALPVPNRQAVESTILLAQALGCTINKHSKFDRKHYFYPDLPKGYQISQYDEPIGVGGQLVIANEVKQSQGIATSSRHGGTPRNDKLAVRIRRVHLEEDTGKLMHEGNETLVDFNRAGVPLVEIVTEPDFDNSADVKRFLEELQVIVRYLGISDADMEKGSMRLEPNISLRVLSSRAERGDLDGIATSPTAPFNDNIGLPNYKVEVKNINSFRFAKAAIDYELARHQELSEKGETPAQETRGWDSVHKKTVSQRTKEEAHDYRYFPEPDIPPMEFSESELLHIKDQLPELPNVRVARYVNDFGLRYEDAVTLTRDKKIAQYYETVLSKLKNENSPLNIANLIVNKRLSTDLSEEEFAQEALKMSTTKETDEPVIIAAIETVLAQNLSAVADYKSGKENALMFLVGQVMKEMKGQADATLVRDKIKEVLHNE